MKEINVWPSFSLEEAEAVKRVLLSNKVNYWTGSETREFEKEFAGWCGTHYAVALANGTLALELALKALEIGPGDEVIVTPRTFIASVSCVVNAGATPVFADVERDSGNISASTISAVLSPKTKAVICVHLGGWPCDMDPIMRLAEMHKFFVIEDCAQAHGAHYKGRSVGSIGHIGAWSFCQDKIMTTGGEGGMVTTNDNALWGSMWSYKDHGKSFATVYEKQHPPGFRWLHESFGTNARMLEIQAVIGRIQLKRMSGWTKKRASNAKFLDEILRPYSYEGGPIRVPDFGCSNSCVGTYGKVNACALGCIHARYKYYAYVCTEALSSGWNRDRIIDEINSKGVLCFQGGCSEVYLEKAFDNTGWRPAARLPVAKELGETSLMFLVHPTLAEQEMQRVGHIIGDVLKRASKNTYR
jgi:dTDP-4-amino-4,6-dideoxygalactose transaminase